MLLAAWLFASVRQFLFRARLFGALISVYGHDPSPGCQTRTKKRLTPSAACRPSLGPYPYTCIKASRKSKENSSYASICYKQPKESGLGCIKTAQSAQTDRLRSCHGDTCWCMCVNGDLPSLIKLQCLIGHVVFPCLVLLCFPCQFNAQNIQLWPDRTCRFHT